MSARQRTEVQFKKVSNTEVFISETEANYTDSMALLQQKHLRAMTYQEALVLIDRNPGLMGQLKEKWFWLAGKGLKEEGYHIFDNEGKLVKDKGEKNIVFAYNPELELYITFENGKQVEGDGGIEKTVFASPGNNPLSLEVLADLNTHFGGRFNLDAKFNEPLDVAPVVVGVPIDFKMAAPKIAEALRTEE